MAKLIAVMLVLAYTGINGVRAGVVTDRTGVPAWYDGPVYPGVTKYCLSQPVERLPSGEMDAVFKNRGGCTCKEAKQSQQQMAQSGEGPDFFVPQCDESGKWKSKQTAVGGAFCFNKNGNQITKWKAEPVTC